MFLVKIYNFLLVSWLRFSKTFFYIVSFLYIKVYLFILFCLNGVNYLAAYSINKRFSSDVNDLIILHYNVDFGVDLIGEVGKIFIIPTIGLIISLINIFLLFAFAKYKYFKFIAHLLLITANLVNIFLILSLALIYLINLR